ncbi:hypothetical protein SASPL_103645 [Salvia splendens]|uniref:CTLH domain-containing protein n=1 Tax=Salvia splendens TaxID=180675 RepID=A0A8X9A7S6_SALSN|nr:hypothetical protein SASPL_103645 [Salvia splendens]
MDADPAQFGNIDVNESDIHTIVLSYLAHNCFKDTLESFVSCTGMKQPVDHLQDMEKRKTFCHSAYGTSGRLLSDSAYLIRIFRSSEGVEQPFLKGSKFGVRDRRVSGKGLEIWLCLFAGIYHFALDGNASKAIEMTEEFAPGLLEENKDLHFDLLSLHFVELVSSHKTQEALLFAQCQLTDFGKEQKYVKKLEDFMALLAYDEPEKSPMFHLVSSEHRQNVAESLNRAILAHSKLPSYSAMERLIQQTTVVRQCLSQELGKELDELAPSPKQSPRYELHGCVNVIQARDVTYGYNVVHHAPLSWLLMRGICNYAACIST